MKEILEVNNNEESQNKRISDFLDKKEEEAITPIPGEIEKTQEEIEFIKYTAEKIQAEIEKCGSLKKYSCDPKQIHFLPEKIFDELVPKPSEGESQGVWESQVPGRMLMRYKGEKYSYNFLHDITHEMLHDASHGSFVLDINDDSLSIKGMERSGFGFPGRERTHFYGLNELITETIAWDILRDSLDDSDNRLKNIMEGRIYETPDMEFENDEILYCIVEKIADIRKVSKSVLWDKIKLSYFEGGISLEDIRDVEKTFGTGSLRVLDEISPYNDIREGINKKIYQYFKTDNIEECDELRKEILSKKG